jgi:hypothetical protein
LRWNGFFLLFQNALHHRRDLWLQGLLLDFCMRSNDRLVNTERSSDKKQFMLMVQLFMLTKTVW